MVRRMVPVLLIVGSLFLAVSTTSADGTWLPYTQGPLAALILGLSHYHAAFTVTHVNEKHDLNWTTGLVTVNFHIMNQSTYDNWTAGRPWTALIDHLNITGEYFEWVAWYSENQVFHFIWYNPTVVSTSLVGDYHIAQWVEVEGNIPGFSWQAVLIGLACPIALLITSRRRRLANKERRPRDPNA